MTAGKFNLEIEQGEDFGLWVQWKSNGVGVDLTGGRMIGSIFSKTGEVYFTFDTEANDGSATFDTAAVGKARLAIPSAKTKELYFDGACWEIWAIKSDGKRKRLLQGSVCKIKTYTEI